MTPKEFQSRFDALSTANLFAARVVVPFAKRLSRHASMPDSECLVTLLNEAIQEAVPADVPARWLVVESIRNDLPDILTLAREWLLVAAAEAVRTAEAEQIAEARRISEARERCPRCEFSFAWNTASRTCGHCGHCGYEHS